MNSNNILENKYLTYILLFLTATYLISLIAMKRHKYILFSDIV